MKLKLAINSIFGMLVFCNTYNASFAAETNKTVIPNPIIKCLPTAIENDSSVNLADFHGKVVYLDFWASWCAPCRASFPFMNSLHQEFNQQGIAVVGISLDTTKKDALNFLAKTPANFTVAIDPKGVCPQEFGVQGMPSSYILGVNGEVLYTHNGFKEKDQEKLRAVIQAIVKEQKPVQGNAQ